MDIQRAGSLPTETGPDDWFTGRVQIDPLFQAEEPGRAAGARVAAVVTALDRQERGQGAESAATEASAELDAPVCSIVTVGDVLGYLDERGDRPGDRAEIAAYRSRYGA